MKKPQVILLVAALCMTHSVLRAEDDLSLAANQNFGPRKADAVVEPAPAPVAAPAAKPAPAPTAVTAPAAAPTAPALSPVIQDEIIKRQEAQLVARKMIDEGQKLYNDGKYTDAIAKLEAALKILPRAKATEIEASRAKHSLTDSYYQLADKAYRAKDNAKAKEYAAKALQYDSQNIQAENILVKVKWVEQEAAAAAKRAKLEGATAVPTGPEVDKSPEFIAKQQQIKKLFREAKLLANSGQFDEAEKKYKQILLLDRYNDDALRHLANVNSERMDSADFARENTRERALWQVADAWREPISGDIRPPEVNQSKPIGFSRDQATILEKLNKIVFPAFQCREAVISDVINDLAQKSRDLDPDKVGINIVLGAGVTGGTTDATQPAPVSGSRPITLNLRNVPMAELLKYVCDLANLKYRVEANAILILPRDTAEGALITRTYPVNASSIKPLLATLSISAPAGGGDAGAAIGGDFRTMGTGGDTMAAPSGDIRQFFVDNGVPFPKEASVSFNERTSKITIRNTAENLEIFERVLSELNVTPSQVEIESKFVDISQGDLKELGFQWFLGQNKQLTFFNAGNVVPGTPAVPAQPATYDLEGNQLTPYIPEVPAVPATGTAALTAGLRGSGSLPGSAIESLLQSSTISSEISSKIGTFTSFLSRPDLSVVINALAQKKGTDVLSAPKITTLSGAQAQVRVVQEFIYPTEFSTPTSGNGGITPSIPSAFKTREVGVILNVTPTVGPDGYTINLVLTPEVSEFRGFIDYSPAPSRTTIANDSGDIVQEYESTLNFKIVQPLFETRNIQTSVVIWDGQTVVLGGLMREDVAKLDDKVPLLGDIPVLGRLFRSKTTSRSKRNLLIFVTANLIDPAGNKIHRQDISAVSK